MKQAKNFGHKKMWYVRDKDGWGKLYTSKPERGRNIWTSATNEPEPKEGLLLIPREAQMLGKTWADEPCEVEVIYDLIITIKEQ